MVEAFAMTAGTALEYGDRMLACLNQTEHVHNKLTENSAKQQCLLFVFLKIKLKQRISFLLIYFLVFLLSYFLIFYCILL